MVIVEGPIFKEGQLVEKFTGDYRCFGIVVSLLNMALDLQTEGGRFEKAKWRYVVRHESHGGGYFCHIYSGTNIRRVMP